MHGYPNVIRSEKRMIKLVWIFFMAGLFGVCFYLIVQSFIEYFRYETSSKVELVYDAYLELPAISICFSNFFQNQNAIPLVLSYLSNVTNTNISNVNDLKNSYDFHNHSEYWDYFMDIYRLKKIISSPTYTNNQKKMFGFNASQFFLICSFNMKKCDPTELIWYFDLLYGNCFKL